MIVSNTISPISFFLEIGGSIIFVKYLLATFLESRTAHFILKNPNISCFLLNIDYLSLFPLSSSVSALIFFRTLRHHYPAVYNSLNHEKVSLVLYMSIPGFSLASALAQTATCKHLCRVGYLNHYYKDLSNNHNMTVLPKVYGNTDCWVPMTELSYAVTLLLLVVALVTKLVDMKKTQNYSLRSSIYRCQTHNEKNGRSSINVETSFGTAHGASRARNAIETHFSLELENGALGPTIQPKLQGKNTEPDTLGSSLSRAAIDTNSKYSCVRHSRAYLPLHVPKTVTQQSIRDKRKTNCKRKHSAIIQVRSSTSTDIKEMDLALAVQAVSSKTSLEFLARTKASRNLIDKEEIILPPIEVNVSVTAEDPVKTEVPDKESELDKDAEVPAEERELDRETEDSAKESELNQEADDPAVVGKIEEQEWWCPMLKTFNANAMHALSAPDILIPLTAIVVVTYFIVIIYHYEKNLTSYYIKMGNNFIQLIVWMAPWLFILKNTNLRLKFKRMFQPIYQTRTKKLQLTNAHVLPQPRV